MYLPGVTGREMSGASRPELSKVHFLCISDFASGLPGDLARQPQSLMTVKLVCWHGTIGNPFRNELNELEVKHTAVGCLRMAPLAVQGNAQV